jgi:hypothetical protein
MLRGFVYVGTCSLARGGQDGGGWREGHGEPITTGAALVSGTQRKQETRGLALFLVTKGG